MYSKLFCSNFLVCVCWCSDKLWCSGITSSISKSCSYFRFMARRHNSSDFYSTKSHIFCYGFIRYAIEKNFQFMYNPVLICILYVYKMSSQSLLLTFTTVDFIQMLLTFLYYNFKHLNSLLYIFLNICLFAIQFHKHVHDDIFKLPLQEVICLEYLFSK